jgi:hypothetical protein
MDKNSSFDDLITQNYTSFEVFNKAIRLYFKNKITKVSSDYLLECLTNHKYGEISLIPNLFDRKLFFDDDYEVSGLFVDNKEDERFFILKKDNDFYALDISKEYEFLIERK